jgi:hypothetical protein
MLEPKLYYISLLESVQNRASVEILAGEFSLNYSFKRCIARSEFACAVLPLFIIDSTSSGYLFINGRGGCCRPDSGMCLLQTHTSAKVVTTVVAMVVVVAGMEVAAMVVVAVTTEVAAMVVVVAATVADVSSGVEGVGPGVHWSNVLLLTMVSCRNVMGHPSLPSALHGPYSFTRGSMGSWVALV